MNTPTSLPPLYDLDTTMLKVARDLAMGIYQLEVILKNNNVPNHEFLTWKEHPRFLEYLKSEREAWNSATNTSDRVKLKASIVMEEFMLEAHAGLQDRKIDLGKRVELGKLVAKLAGLGESKAVGIGGSGFQLSINIGQGAGERLTITPQMNFIDNDDLSSDELDDFDPLVSPNTLDD